MKNFNHVRPKKVISKSNRLFIYAISFLRFLFRADRVKVLNYLISDVISNVPIKKPSMINYGSGNSMLSEFLLKRKIISKYIDLDIFSDDDRKNYINLSNVDISKLNLKKHDIGCCIDVLHHCNASEQEQILSFLKKKSKYILIKDHFEFSIFSRFILIVADIFGNYFYDVSIPNKYYKRQEFQILLAKMGFKQSNIRIITPLKIYNDFISLILKPKYQFFCLIKI